MTALRRAHGSGAPVTLVVPGLGATAGEARLPASGVPGTRVVLTFPSHADAPDAPAGYWTYPRLAAEVRAAAQATGARQAIGVSLGAAALCALLADDPPAFDRLVLMFPATLAAPRPTTSAALVGELARAADAGDRPRLRDLVATTSPAAPAPYIEDRTNALLRLGPALHAVATEVPLTDPTALTHVRARVLVVAAQGDPLHPVEVAEETAAAFPDARLEVLPSPAPLVTHRPQVRALVAAFLSGSQQHQ